MDSEIVSNPSSLYYIYGEEEQNIYETIGKSNKSVVVYDEVFSEEKRRSTLDKPLYVIKGPGLPAFNNNLILAGKTTKIKCYKQYMKPSKRKIIVSSLLSALLVTVLVAYRENGNSSNTPTSANTITTTRFTSINPDWITATTSPKSTSSDPSNVTCAKLDYAKKDWYIPHPNPKYNCDDLSTIEKVKVQILQGKNQNCDKKPGCDKLIKAYKDFAKESACYSFYIDGDGNVYQGRDWDCPVNSGELWVAVMVKQCDSASPPCDKLLEHFNNEILSYGRKCDYVSNYLDVDYKSEKDFP